MARYRTDQLRDVFKGERTRLQSAESKITTETYMQNSLAIRGAFEEAEKEGFTLKNLQGLPIDKEKAFVEQDGKVYLVYKKTMKPVGKGKPINLKNKKEVLDILYQNSKIQPTHRNIEITGGNKITPFSLDFLNKFNINK